MKQILTFFFFLIVSSFQFIHLSFAQETQISGIINDSKTGEPMIGVSIAVKNKILGTVSDTKGNFTLTVKTIPPFTLVFSSVGYASQELEITSSITNLKIQLIEQNLMGQEVVVSASRVEEKILESPVSIEKLDLLQIRDIPAANFYDGLSRIKGVDMSVQSLTFSNPNTRGFNGNTNYRMNQIIDGVDNVVPGLSFAAGNIVGLSQLDVESVELLVGASSALYGPGGMNGTLLMSSKNPFDYQGLSMSLQTGIMHVGANYQKQPAGMYDFNMRFAKAFNNRLAIKTNLSYLTALDWQASDYRNRSNLNDPNTSIYTNPGYDGVNVYGDENVGQVNIGKTGLAPQIAQQVAAQTGKNYEEILNLFPQTQYVNRTGYREKDFANYNTQSLKFNASIHYRVSDKIEAILQGSYGNGTSLYTANNRFSLIDFKFYTLKAEVKGSNFFIRAWTVGENAGNSYDLGGLALRFNEAWRSSNDWYRDYIQGFVSARIVGNPMEVAYDFARTIADNRYSNGNIYNRDSTFARPLAGEQQFNSLSNQLKSTLINEGGAKIIDKTKMHHFEGMYNFSNLFKFAEVIAGVSHRIYRINSEGTVFGDTPGNPITVNQFGAYIQITKKMRDERLKATMSARYDRNQNFDARITPRVSLVYALNEQKKQYLRGSIQTAFRFPSTSDQFTDLSAGGVYQVIGGLPRFRQKYNLEETNVYPMDSPNPVTAKADMSKGTFKFPQMRPERVIAYEIGYKGVFKDNLLIDAYVYYNTYNGFLATQGLVQNPNPDGTGGKKYTTTISTDQPINAFGWAISGDYKFNKGYVLGTNLAYNTLAYNDLPIGFQTNFNSPNYRTNLYLSNRNIYKNIGFSVNWRWQNKFVWESTFGVGEIPAYHTLDAQVNYRMNKLKTLFKLGGSNILNNYYTTGFGNPQIGALYYVSITFDQFMK